MRLTATIAVLFVAGLIVAAPPKVVEEFTGKVIAVTDGDSINVQVNDERIAVRLDGIDAPEFGQLYAANSKKFLSNLVLGKVVTIKKTGTDRYDRTLGMVLVGNLDANAKLVESGWAWHFKKYNDEDRLADLEDAARAAQRGLWSQRNPTAPWDYRAQFDKSDDPPKAKNGVKTSFWLNTSSGIRHNQTCRHYQSTKQGRICKSSEGKPCKACGG